MSWNVGVPADEGEMVGEDADPPRSVCVLADEGVIDDGGGDAAAP